MLRAGTVIAGYEIGGVIGEGGMSTVYEARQISLNRLVAFKVLSQELVDDEGVFRARFERECQIQAELDHAHIVPIYEAAESEFGLWLAMRLVRGETLRELIDAGTLTPRRTVELLAPIAKALDLAHQRGLIHRDLTPRNILIDEQGHPYLADFGITKRRGDRSLTKPGQFVGTNEYVAPEQIKDEPASAQADVYSLAAIVFECLGGRVPFSSADETAVLYAHLIEKPPRVSELGGDLPPELDAVLAKGMAKRPEDRQQRATELIESVRAVVDEAARPRTPVPAEDPEPPSNSAGRRTWWRPPPAPAVFAILGLLIVGLAVGALAAGNEPVATPETTRAGDLSVTVPAGWSVAAGGGGGIPGLSLTDPLRLESNGGGRATVGMSSATGESLLPQALKGSGGEAPRGTPVSLGSLQALRYTSLSDPKGEGKLTAFVAPLSTGVATVACTPDAGEVREVCGRLAASLRSMRGVAFKLGPSSQLARSLRRQFGILDRRRSRLRSKLGSAAGASSQAATANRLADAFRDAARPLSRLLVTPQSSAALDALVVALREARDAYRAVAGAAQQENESSYAAASRRVTAAEGAVDGRLRSLRRLGYRVTSTS